ncbi:MAG: acyltransferase family protein [Bdellovibrionia bacterium]
MLLDQTSEVTITSDRLATTRGKRDSFIDALKGVAILTVVLGHTLQMLVPDFDHHILYRLIYSVHMPFFMFLSGFVALPSMMKAGFVETVRNKFLRLVVPFLSWYFIVGYLFLGLVCHGSAGDITFGEHVIRLAKAPDWGLWFLWELFLCDLVLALVVAGKKRFNLKMAGFTAALIIATVLFGLQPRSGLGLALLRWHLPFFSAGVLLHLYREQLIVVKRYWVELSLLAYPVLFSFWMRTESPSFLVKGIGDLTLLLALVEKLFRYATAFTGITVIWIAMKSLVQTKLSSGLAKLGQYSLDIYALHFYFLGTLAIASSSLEAGKQTQGSMISVLLSTVAALVISLTLSFCLFRKSRVLSWLFLGIKSGRSQIA